MKKTGPRIMRKLLLCAMGLLSAYQAESLTVTENKEARTITVDTSFYTVGILPGKGGRITSITLKPSGSNFLCAGGAGVYKSDGGIGKDVEISQGYPGDMLEAEYSCSIVKNTGDEAILKLTFDQGRENSVLKDIVLEKSFTFSESRPAIKVDILMKNNGVPRNLGYRVHNAGLMVCDGSRIFLPRETTLVNGTYPVAGGGFIDKPVNNWAGFYDIKKKEGIIFCPARESLDKFLWSVKRRTKSPSVLNIEWFCKEFNLGNNASWSAEYYIIPLLNIDAIPVYADSDILIYKKVAGDSFSLESQGIGLARSIKIDGTSEATGKNIFSDELNGRCGSSREIKLPQALNDSIIKVTLTEGGTIRSFPVILQKNINIEPCDSANIALLVEAESINSEHLALKKRFENISDPEVLKELKRYSDSFTSEITSKGKSLDLNCLRSLNDSIAALYNKNAYKIPQYVLWKASPYAPFSFYDQPSSGFQSLKQLDVSMAGNEYLATTFMITNLSESDEVFRITIPSLKDPNGNELGKLTVRRAYFVLSSESQKLMPCVLPSLEGTGNSFTVPKGQTGQVWFTIRTNKNIAAGHYCYPVKIELQGKKTSSQTLPLNLTVKPFSFPEKRDIDAFTCAYFLLPEKDACRKHLWESREMAFQDLKDHYENRYILHTSYMPVPEIEKDSNGKNVVKVDFSNFDYGLEVYKDKPFYLFVWKSGGRYLKNFAGTGYAYPSPEWNELFSSWLTQWIEHIKSKGIGYDRFAMYPLDEKPAELLSVAAKTIKDVDPKVKIFATLGFSYYSLADLKKVSPYVDMMCISSMAKGEKLDFLKKEGKHIWPENQPNPSKGLPPYTMRWTMWKWYDMGLNGCEAWAYNHASGPGSLWNDFDGVCQDENFVYDGQTAPIKTTEAVIPSKQWEAWREGLQDWQYLKILEKLIGECRSKKVDEAILKESESLLKLQVRNVIDNPSDASLAEKAKEKILEEIIKLKKLLDSGKGA